MVGKEKKKGVKVMKMPKWITTEKEAMLWIESQTKPKPKGTIKAIKKQPIKVVKINNNIFTKAIKRTVSKLNTAADRELKVYRALEKKVTFKVVAAINKYNKRMAAMLAMGDSPEKFSYRQQFINEKMERYTELFGYTDRNKMWNRMKVSVHQLKTWQGLNVKAPVQQFSDVQPNAFKTDLFKGIECHPVSVGRTGLNWFEKYADLTGIDKIPADLFAAIKATTIIQQTYNPMYKSIKGFEQPLSNYQQIDRNSAYMTILCSGEYKLPKNLLQTVGHFETDTDTTYCMYVVDGKICSAEKAKANECTTYIFDTFDKEHFADLFVAYDELYQSEDKKIAKKLAVSGIGMMYSKGYAITTAIWIYQMQHIQMVKKAITHFGGKVVKVHTDSVGYIGDKDIAKKLELIGDYFGMYKYECTDGIITYENAGNYVVKDINGKEIKSGHAGHHKGV